MRQSIVEVTLAITLAQAWAQSDPAISLHPANPRYFLFRGRPVYLLSATEHYGSVINRPFDFEKYLDDAAAHKMTMTRTFLLFRELQSARNPSSPCKPESPDYIAPYPRTGPGKAMDGEPVYDLDQWNAEYFDRLHRFLDAASKRGIVVELTVFSNTYKDDIWALNPLRAKNNRQGIGNVDWADYLAGKDRELLQRQVEFARKAVRETSAYDNVYYEICNEPGGGVAGHASPAEVDAWQQKIAAVLRDEMRKLNRPHLIAGQQAFTYSPHFRFPFDQAFTSSMLDLVNVHPLPGTELAGKLYQLGNFMSKELMLGNVAEFCRAAYTRKKPTVLDEDNTASLYRDPAAWTIHRKRAWTALLNGAHYDYIDFSITVGNEAGTPVSRRGIRAWMQHLSEFMAGFDFVNSRPAPDWISSMPDQMVASTLSAGDRDYAAYLASSREVNDPEAGRATGGKVAFGLPEGRFEIRVYSPVTGEFSPAIAMTGARTVTLDLPPFREDIVIRARLAD